MKHPKQAPLVMGRTAIAAAIALATPSYAQMTLEEVIVTAQKRQQTVQDVPSSVAAFSEDLLNKSNTRNFDDLSKITSGMDITASPDGFGSVIRIRGIGNNAFAPSIRPAVGIFLNEVPLGSPEAAYNNMADIVRIEVLKGPQATLFGKEVSSGAISLFTKRPDTETLDGYVEGNFGNLGLQDSRIGGNLPLGDNFGVRASVYRNTRDGYTDNVTTGDELGEVDANGYRIRLLWEPTADFNAILSYEDHEIEVLGSHTVAAQYGDMYHSWEQLVEGVTDPAGSQLNILDPYAQKTASAASPTNNTDTKIWSLNVEWAINDEWTLTSVTSDQEYFLYTTGMDGSAFTSEAGEQVPDSGGISVGPYKITEFFQETGTDTFTQELRFNYEGDAWSVILGGFYAETDLLSYVPFNQLVGVIDLGPAGGLPIFAPGVSNINDDTTEWAIFTHSIYTIREGLDLTFGARYSEVEKEAVKAQLVGDWGPFGEFGHPLVPSTPWGDELPSQKDSWDEITGTLKLTWWLNDELSVYGGWDRGFKAGGHNVCKGTDDEPNCPAPFQSELADNFELGFKGRFLDNTLVWNTAAFYQTYDDYQVEIQDDEGIGSHVVNAAKVKIQGIETDFQWLASDYLLVAGNLAYIDARWDEYENAGCIRPQYKAVACTAGEDGKPVQDLGGKRLNYTSPWSANLNATWNDGFSNGIGWYLRGEIAFKDDRYFFPDLDPDLTDGSYTLLNASLGFTGAAGNWDVILWGKNLTNEDYLNTANRNRDASSLGNVTGVTPVEGYRVEAGLQRSYGVTLKYRYGNF